MRRGGPPRRQKYESAPLPIWSEFIESLRGKFPKSVRQTAIYSKSDGIMDWRVCRTGDPRVDLEVSSTHTGFVCSPLVYKVVAERLAGC